MTGAGWWTAARPAGIKSSGPLIGMHSPSLSSPEDKLECLRTRHERLICFRVQTTTKYFRGLGNKWEAELFSQGAGPARLWTDGDASCHGES